MAGRMAALTLTQRSLACFPDGHLPLQVGCNKVYTSTSDVMTHENFHKKNTQLINDGFQRFRATEDCGTADCQFYGQKTTHFHCRWAGSPPGGRPA